MKVNYQQLISMRTNSENSQEFQHQIKLARSCRDFEALLAKQLLNEMRKSLNKKEGAFATQSEFFNDQLYQNYATELANRSTFGLGKTLYEQINYLERATQRYT